MNELDRQLFHIDLGLIVILTYALLGRMNTIYLLSLTILAGVLLIHLKLQGAKLPLIDKLLHRFERPGEIQGYGSLWYAVGFLLIFTMLQMPSQLVASSLILGIGDGLSTLIGKAGGNRLHHNAKKTYEGSAAFFISSAVLTFPFLGSQALILAALATLAESISIGVDDNLTIPAMCIVFLKLFGG